MPSFVTFIELKGFRIARVAIDCVLFAWAKAICHQIRELLRNATFPYSKLTLRQSMFPSNRMIRRNLNMTESFIRAKAPTLAPEVIIEHRVHQVQVRLQQVKVVDA